MGNVQLDVALDGLGELISSGDGFKAFRNLVLRSAVWGEFTFDSSIQPDDSAVSSKTRLPPGWTLRALNEIAEVRLGRQRSPEKASGERMRPYLRAANVGWSGLQLADVKQMAFTESESATYELRPGDILLSEASGSPSEVGKPAQYRGEIAGCCFQNTLIRVRLHEGMLPDYYEYVLRSEALSGRFIEGARGLGIQHLGASRLSQWPVPCPPELEQAEIVKFLHSFEQLIARFGALQFERSTAHSSLTEAAFRELASGDAGTAIRLLGDLLTSEGDVSTFEASLREFVISGPDALISARHMWLERKLADVAVLTNGRAFKASEWKRNGLPIIRIQNLTSSNAPYNYADPDVVDERHRVRNGDVLLSWSGTPGTSFGVFIWDRGDAALNQHIFKCNLAAGVDPRWFQLTVNVAISKVLDTAHGSAGLKHLTKRQLADLAVSVPPLEDQASLLQFLSLVVDKSKQLRDLLATR